ncbi:hypothetical protein HN789_05045 [archaeon]|jgi:hypothetical protein|nr:hypothetical protein [archaeon]MBT4022879.1 hypothetical protein [archaeon]MBT4272526.1 hypothetical protein [archaeon]MBT4460406.1 hypothetical protein [archaeon]MBT4859037.1 hypothetical protein [archaeon]
MYTELTATCVECGKDIKTVVMEGSDLIDYLCPRCSSGEFVMDFED